MARWLEEEIGKLLATGQIADSHARWMFARVESLKGQAA